MTSMILKKALCEHLLIGKVVLAQYRRQGLLNLGFVLSLAIATSTLLTILILNHASKSQYALAELSLSSPVAFYILPKQGNTISKTDFARLRQAGFHQLSPVLTFKKALVSGKNIRFKAVDLLPLAITRPDYDPAKVHIGRSALKRLALTPEAAVILADHRRLDSRYHKDGNWGSEVLLDITLAWQLFPELSDFSYLTSPPLTENEQTRLSLTLPPQLTLQKAWSLDTRSGFADALHLNLSALAILAFIVSLFIAYQAGEQAWRKRSELAAQLRLLGVSLPVLFHVLLLEAAGLILLTSMFGTAIALLLVTVLLPLLGLTLEQLYNLNISGQLSWHPVYALWSLLIATLAVFTTLAKQYRRIAGRYISRFARQSAHPGGEQNNKSSVKQATPGLALLLLFFLIPDVAPNTQTSTGALSPWHLIMAKYGLLLLATIALLPLLLQLFIKGLTTLSPGFKFNFLLQDARSQVNRRNLPLAAFYLALTTSIAAALMINSFETAFTDYLDQNLDQDLYIRFTPEQKAPLLAWIKAQANSAQYQIEEYRFYYRGNADLAGEVLDLGIYSSAKQLASLVFKEKGDSGQGPGCFINEPLAIKRQLAIGQQLTVSRQQATFSCRIRGIYYDYGNPKFELTLALSQARKHNFPLVEKGLSLHLGKGETTPEQLRQALSQALNITPEQIIATAQTKTLALKIFEQTFIITRAIALVLIGIACLGLFLSAKTLELARAPQLLILRSLGYSRSALFRFMLGQWLLMALACIIISAPVAVILAETLVSKALPASFGWSMPLQLSAAVFITTGLGGLLCLLPALLLPLYKLEPGQR
ncbi:FtsX-like permease family protein [Thalassomonas actiniarum]|uniref:ABC transporter permease n=1 Tax=Thalassomonas actiniarum TaxID=485447 RepID=A0AAF0C2E1_9GAMM|nr:FtsX-like permease family protein [Thalassomonas actiniarum]WDD99981.1 ABC transporter permease [Thalassomonas actiniarum]